MNVLTYGLLPLILCLAAAAVRADPPAGRRKVVLVIHGGAGVLLSEKMTPEVKKGYEDALRLALRTGYDVLQDESATSLDAVETTIKVLEDSPLFNAGRGAVFTHDGRNELDASIMNGKDKRAGAVAAATRIKNPISAARAVMEKSPHVMMTGDGADRFAIASGVAEVSPVYFWTEARWKALQEMLQEEERERQGEKAAVRASKRRYFGTVGAVALDRHGDLAAGTSTGGMTNKRYGRVGDSPIIGAGTYAENGACGVSCTGHGEIFIRHAVAYDVVAMMKYGKERSVREAAKKVLGGLPAEEGGVGGLIALDNEGNAAMEFDGDGMYRGTVTEDGEIEVAIYR